MGFATLVGETKTPKRSASAGILPFKRRHLYRLIDKGAFPKPLKVGGVPAWPVEQISAWIEAQKAGGAQ